MTSAMLALLLALLLASSAAFWTQVPRRRGLSRARLALGSLQREDLQIDAPLDSARFHSACFSALCWEQNPSEVHVLVPLPSDVAKSAVLLDVSPTRLSLRVAGEVLIPNIALRHRVQARDAMWYFDGGAPRCIHVELSKQERYVNWAALTKDLWEYRRDQALAVDVESSDSPLLDLLFPDAAARPNIELLPFED
mmetsp:Transcript_4865/g.19503  ORF Transcript_4865/g.19503 Transcript_4865/m.19503 type:complete len:195 (-) Transcript_4865:79-663(-)|eukprot:scaffold2249_cov272-Pinguiococcus_pyrenoidosus.AAC.14